MAHAVGGFLLTVARRWMTSSSVWICMYNILYIYIYIYRQVTRGKAKSGAVVKHQMNIVVLKNHIKCKRHF